MSVDFFLPLHKATYLAKASQASVDAGTAVTVLTYLHGVKEAMDALAELGEDYGVDLIELTSLKPLDMDTIKESLARTNRLIILDESTKSGGVGATISARVAEEAFDLLDQPVQRYFRAARLVYYPVLRACTFKCKSRHAQAAWNFDWQAVHGGCSGALLYCD